MELLSLGSDIKMTTLDLEQVISKKHYDIMKDVRKEIDDLGELGEGIFTLSSYNSRQNKKLPCYVFGKKGAMQLALKYDAVTRFKVVAYIEELEARNKPKPPTQLQLAEQVVELLKQQEEDKLKVEFYEKAISTNKWLTFKEVANILCLPELGRNNLMKKLYDLGYLTKFRKPYQRHIDQGLFKVREKVQKTSKGDKVFTYTLVSQKGLERIMKVLS